MRRIVKSDALDALMAKTKHAEHLLDRCFIAFIRVPTKFRRQHGARGYVFFGTDSHLATYGTPLFHAFIVGEPDERVKEIRAAIRYFHEQMTDATSAEDVHGVVVVEMLKDFNQLVIEDKDEPRANTAEVLVFDASNNMYWISYGGQHGGQELGKGRRFAVVRGCYDGKIRRQVEKILYKRCRLSRPTKAKFKSVCRELKRLTKLQVVSYVPVT